MMSCDLLTLARQDTGEQFHQVARTNGGEWVGPCPLCQAGEDRFHIWPNHRVGKARFWCRNCGEKGDFADYLQRVHGMSVRESLRAAGIARSPRGENRRLNAPVDASAPPPQQWQDRAKGFALYAQEQLWGEGGKAALAYLNEERGLANETVEHFGIGYYARSNNSSWHHDRDVERWGLKPDAYWSVSVPPGIILPCRAQGSLWYVKVRCPHVGEGTHKWDALARRLGYARAWKDKATGKLISPKHQCVTGSQSKALFGIDDWAGDGRPLLLCEGEFDAMLAWQELSDTVDVATFGGASMANGRIAPRWMEALRAYRRILVAYDVDENGAGDSGAYVLLRLFGQAVRAMVPEGGDLTGFWKGGGDLQAWLSFTLTGLGMRASALSPRGDSG